MRKVLASFSVAPDDPSMVAAPTTDTREEAEYANRYEITTARPSDKGRSDEHHLRE
jgi:hypothetical protein